MSHQESAPPVAGFQAQQQPQGRAASRAARRRAMQQADTARITGGGAAAPPPPAAAATTSIPSPTLAAPAPASSSSSSSSTSASSAPTPSSSSSSLPPSSSSPSPPSSSLFYNTRVSCSSPDARSCSPAFLRSSLYCVPASPALLKQSQLSFSLVSCPLYNIEVPLVSHSPMRCSRCAAYMNPYVSWVAAGRSFVCSICRHTNAVPEEDFAPLLPDGSRTDAPSRHDLSSGSVDYAVGAAFHQKGRPPAPLQQILLLDVSHAALVSGALATAVEAAYHVVANVPDGSPLRLAVATFSDAVHFYDVDPRRSKARMLVSANGAAPSDALLYAQCGTAEGRASLCACIQALMHIWGDATRAPATALMGEALACARRALPSGGRVVCFTSRLPNQGSGVLADRQRQLSAESKSAQAEGERLLYSLDANNSFWKELSASYLAAGASLDFFLTPQHYCDVGSLAHVASTLGGRVFCYAPFTPQKHGVALREELRGRLTRLQGYDAVARFRCSKGLAVDTYAGPFRNDRVEAELEMAAIDECSTLVAHLRMDESINPQSPSDAPVVQLALLYTTAEGERRVRVHTLRLEASAQLTAVFRAADLDTTLYSLAETASRTARTQGLKAARALVARRTGEMLGTYRQHCARNPAPGQLILPEALKLLPCYVLGLLKSRMLRPGLDISVDERSECLWSLGSLPLAHLLRWVYPRLTPLHLLEDGSREGFPDAALGVCMPESLRLLRSSLQDDGVYLLEGASSLYVWVGKNANPALLEQLLGSASPNYAALQWDAIARPPTPYAQRVANIVGFSRMDWERRHFKDVLITEQGGTLDAAPINGLLVEDSVSSSMSLTGFLRHLHTRITTQHN